MVDTDRQLAEVERAVDDYLETYLTRRDLDGTYRLITTSMTGFGTGGDENGYTYPDSLRLFRRDVHQAPNTVRYQTLYRNVSLICDTVALARLRVNLETEIARQKVRMNEFRLSIVLVCRNDRWLIDHQHISQPSTAHGELESFPVKELEERTAVLTRLVAERTHELAAAHERLERMAITDGLTGVWNRTHGDAQVRHLLSHVTSRGGRLSVVLLDIDHFKQVNDDLGHNAGDAVLVEFAEILMASVRESDLVARWGGEEFLLLVPGMGGSAAADLAERVRAAVERHDFSVGLTVTASFGVTEFASGDTAETLIERADRAMYDAKHAGRNRVMFGAVIRPV